jgi:small-conductance mechanosensitive channel
MPGNMGNKTCTVKNLRVLKIDPHENLLYVAGHVPGAANGYVNVKDAIYKMTKKACFPEGIEIPFPTFLGNPNSLPRELLPPAPTKRQLELDPFLRQRTEATG